jgi:hypothetical protein
LRVAESDQAINWVSVAALHTRLSCFGPTTRRGALTRTPTTPLLPKFAAAEEEPVATRPVGVDQSRAIMCQRHDLYHPARDAVAVGRADLAVDLKVLNHLTDAALDLDRGA